jgi:hypothetical protein
MCAGPARLRIMHRCKSLKYIAALATNAADIMHYIQSALFILLAITCLAFTRGEGPQACADAATLLPFVTKQIKKGSSLVIFQGEAVPQVRFSKLITLSFHN